MLKKTVWIAVCCLMLVPLIMASCASQATTTPTAPATQTTPTVSPTTTAPSQPTQTTTAAGDEKPKYGGTIYLAEIREITNWANGLEFC